MEESSWTRQNKAWRMEPTWRSPLQLSSREDSSVLIKVLSHMRQEELLTPPPLHSQLCYSSKHHVSHVKMNLQFTHQIQLQQMKIYLLLQILRALTNQLNKTHTSHGYQTQHPWVALTPPLHRLAKTQNKPAPVLETSCRSLRVAAEEMHSGSFRVMGRTSLKKEKRLHWPVARINTPPTSQRQRNHCGQSWTSASRC